MIKNLCDVENYRSVQEIIVKYDDECLEAMITRDDDGNIFDIEHYFNGWTTRLPVVYGEGADETNVAYEVITQFLYHFDENIDQYIFEMDVDETKTFDFELLRDIDVSIYEDGSLDKDSGDMVAVDVTLTGIILLDKDDEGV